MYMQYFLFSLSDTHVIITQLTCAAQCKVKVSLSWPSHYGDPFTLNDTLLYVPVNTNTKHYVCLCVLLSHS